MHSNVDTNAECNAEARCVPDVLPTFLDKDMADIINKVLSIAVVTLPNAV
jgi:hypothetical protein